LSFKTCAKFLKNIFLKERDKIMIFSILSKNTRITVITGVLFLTNVLTLSHTHAKNNTRTESNSWKEICQNSKKSVVQIFSYIHHYNILEPFKTPYEYMACVTGFFFNEDGDILTNFHVVDEAIALFIQIPSLGKERFEVEFIGGDPQRDIALLKLKDYTREAIQKKLNVTTLPYLEFGDSDMLTEAQDIMALGYPLGQENLKVSPGINAGHESSSAGKLIQTTAPINPGNSGGPFFDTAGNVIGVCSSKIIGAETDNIGYLIPINNVKTVLEELYTTKIIKHPFWGLSFSPTTKHTLEYLNNPTDGGIYVRKVEKESLAEKYGIQKGDIIYAINDNQIDYHGYLTSPWVAESDDKISTSDYLARIKNESPITITLYRAGERIDLDAQITTDHDIKIDLFHPWHQPPLNYEVIGGLVVVELTLNHILTFKSVASESSEFSLIEKYQKPKNQFEPRLIITSILPGSQAHKTKCFMRADRIIETINDLPVKTIEEFRDAVITSLDYLTIQTEDGSFAALPVKELVEEEPLLSQRYSYQISPLIDQLAMA